MCAGKRRNTQENKTKDSAFRPKKAKSLGQGAGMLGRGSAIFQKSLFNTCFLLTLDWLQIFPREMTNYGKRQCNINSDISDWKKFSFKFLCVWLSTPLLKFFYLHFPKLLFVENSLLRSNHRTCMEQWQKLQIRSLVSWNVDDFLLLNKRLIWGLVKWSECNITQVTLELVTTVQKTEVQHVS